MFNKLDISKNNGGKKKRTIADVVRSHGGEWNGSNKTEVLGDVCLLPADFDLAFLSDSAKAAFFSDVKDFTGCDRVGKKGFVDKASDKRRPNCVLLHPEHVDKDKTGEGSEAWVTVKDNGVTQSFDFTRVMFSRGNISEVRPCFVRSTSL